MALDNPETGSKELSAPIVIKNSVNVVDDSLTDMQQDSEMTPPPEPVDTIPAPVEEKVDTGMTYLDTAEDEEEVNEEETATEESEVSHEELLKNLKQIAERAPIVALSKEKEIIDELNKIYEGLTTLSEAERERLLKDIDHPLNKTLDALRWIGANPVKDLKRSISLSSNVSEDTNNVAKSTRGSALDKIASGSETVLSGVQARATFAALLGGIDQVTLPNSGITIALRSVNLSTLDSFHRSAAKSSYEFGRKFGEFYYSYNRFEIVREFVDTILSSVIFGSSYKNFKNKEALYNVISYHDLTTLLWAITSMMYPDGAKIAYKCSKCGEITTDTVDITKLKYINHDIITPEATEWLRTHTGAVSDEDLEQYRASLKLEQTLQHKVRRRDGDYIFKVVLKQATLGDYLSVGKDFLATLTANSNATDYEEVNDYMFYNKFIQYRPWIKSISLINTTAKKICTIVNDGSHSNSLTIDDTLSTFRDVWKDLDSQIDDYILRTRIVHTAFHMEKCPKCGEETDNVNGLVPFDALSYFFTQVVQKLDMDRYERELLTTSQSATNS